MMLSLISAAALIALCPANGPRSHCVVDGDTFWWHGEKIRISDIDAPEIKGRCPRERELAGAARRQVLQLLDARIVEIERRGTDPFGRTLATVSADGRPVGEQLIAQGLASRWPERRNWCA